MYNLMDYDCCDLEFISLENDCIAELRNLEDFPCCSITLGLNLVFGLESGATSKKSLCIGSLKVWWANFLVSSSLLTLRGTRS